MKSWSDHCSSDEESLDDLPEQMEAQKLAEVEPADPTTDDPPPTAEDEVDGPAPEDAPPAAPRTYDFPDQPPFTAFIGNLAYSLKDPEELIAAVKQCAVEVLGQEINILGARISFGPDGTHRGFGYLEIETLDQLKLLMQLNDGKGTIAGRKVQLDTANGNRNKRGSQQRRQQQGESNVDGSRFRGGKYNNRRNNNTNSNKEEGPPKERPSLKLAPRTKPKTEDEKGDAQGPSDIFGGAKARDAQAWEENRKSSRQHNGDNHQKNDGDRRRSTPGGRGGRGGRVGGRGNANSTNTNTESGSKRAPQGKREPKQKLVSPEEKAAAAAAAAKTEVAAPAPAPAAPAKQAAPTNKFALLMDSDSD